MLAGSRGYDGNYPSLTLDKIASMTLKLPHKGKQTQAVLLGGWHGQPVTLFEVAYLCAA